MNLNVEELTETRKKLVVEVSADEVAREEKKILRSVANEARIPGFRPGKAPEKILRQRFGSTIESELRRQLVSVAGQHGIDQSGLKIYQVVEVNGQEGILPGSDARLELTVDLKPEFELPQYKGILTEVPASDVHDHEVEAEIERLRTERASFEVVEREAREGDYVKVSYEGFLDGKPLEELIPEDVGQRAMLSKQENTWEEAGNGEFGVEAVVRGVIGLKTGELKEGATMTFPVEYPVAELAGKEASYNLTVHEVRERKLPAIDGEFLAGLQVADEEALREQIRKQIRERKEGEKFRIQRRQVAEKLVSSTDFPLPESAVEAETRQAMQEIMQSNLQRNVSPEELEKHRESISGGARQAGETRVRTNLILGRIAEEEKIEVTNEDIQRFIMMHSIQSGQKPDQLVRELKKDRDRLMALRQDILLSKTLASVVEWAEEKVVDDALLEEPSGAKGT